MSKKTSKKSTKVSLENDTLIIQIPVFKPLKKSKSGKSLTVATTHGNIATEATMQGKPIMLGVNAYIKAD